MSLRVCPIAPVYAPIERVWSFVAKPANLALWWDGTPRRILPEGEAQPGQRIHARRLLLGIPRDVELLVERVDEAARTLDVMTSLPFGIIIFTHVACTPLDRSTCQLSFGSDFSFSPAWWGWLLERFASQPLYRAVAGALFRLKTAVEKAA